MQYHMAYLNVPIHGFWYSLVNIYGYINSWEEVRTTISGEFMNGIYNYIGYYLTFGYYPLLNLSIPLSLIYFSLLEFTSFVQHLKTTYTDSLWNINYSFFYLYFQYTLQIQKQFLHRQS